MKTETSMIIIGTFAIIIFGMVSNTIIESSRAKADTVLGQGSYACTTEAKICPDGTYVGRVAPYCQFSPCPQGQ